MGLISPGSGVRVPPGALFFFVWCVESQQKKMVIRVAHGTMYTGPVGAIEQRVRLLI